MAWPLHILCVHVWRGPAPRLTENKENGKVSSQQKAKQHLCIIISIVVCFSTFMMGYSFSPFLEVGFGERDAVQPGAAAASDAELMKQYEDLYKTEDK